MESFHAFIEAHGAYSLIGAAAVFFLAGLIKGAVGFALPLLAVSLGSAFLPSEVAVALLIAPAALTNLWQALLRGPLEAWRAFRAYWVLIVVTLCGIVASAPLLVAMPESVFFALLGGGVTLFCAARWLHLRLPDPRRAPRRWEFGLGALAGFFGGFSGIWGPPILMYLIARGVDKREQVAVTGVSFLLGSVVLAAAHIRTGTFNAETAPLSLAATLPTFLGMALGLLLHDRLDQKTFGRATLILLTLSGLNLLRKAMMG